MGCCRRDWVAALLPRLGLFDQIWFAGNHADIGGSYPENESRLSDITLDWMVEFIIDKIPEAGCVIVDKSLLRLYPSADGMMHDECMVGMGGTALHWSKAVRDVPDTAQLHETVYERLAMSSVRNFTSFGPYRPAALQNHRKAKAFFEPTPTEKGPHAGESAQNETQTSGPPRPEQTAAKTVLAGSVACRCKRSTYDPFGSAKSLDWRRDHPGGAGRGVIFGKVPKRSAPVVPQVL
jgi:hypothetical protein